MVFSQYCRIETAAGGVTCTDRAFIRAAHTFLATHVRRSFTHRHVRHEWLREGLKLKAQALDVYLYVVNGGGCRKVAR